MPYCPTMSLLRSVSTFAKASLPGALCEAASCSKTGEITLQGPHLRNDTLVSLECERRGDEPGGIEIDNDIFIPAEYSLELAR
jgi:hypothetical protein